MCVCEQIRKKKKKKKKKYIYIYNYLVEEKFYFTYELWQRSHYENTPIQNYKKFYLQKLKNFSDKKPDIIYISAQNIDCGFSLEAPR